MRSCLSNGMHRGGVGSWRPFFFFLVRKKNSASSAPWRRNDAVFGMGITVCSLVTEAWRFCNQALGKL
jgi:hypothetical protein